MLRSCRDVSAGVFWAAVGPVGRGGAMCQLCIKDAPAKVSASLNDHRNDLCPVPQPSHELMTAQNGWWNVPESKTEWASRIG